MARTKQSHHGGKKLANAPRNRASKLTLPPHAAKKPVTTPSAKPKAVKKRKMSKTEIMCRNSKMEADKIKKGKIYICEAPLRAYMKEFLPNKRFMNICYPLMQTVLHAVVLQLLDNAKQVTAVSKGITLKKEILDCVVKLQKNINKGVAI